ncbi:MAG: hypothetical protein ABIJ34_01275 [archaeon]
MQKQDYPEFINLALSHGILHWPCPDMPHFHIHHRPDLILPIDPQKIMSFLEILAEYNVNPSQYLRLTTTRKDATFDVVHWNHPDVYIDYDERKPYLISLGEWLTEKGYDISDYMQNELKVHTLTF